MMDAKSHWENVYQRKSESEVSWYRTHLERSLELIRSTGVGRDGAIIDVGGGASTLVDDLLAGGYTDVTVLDLSATALARAKARLGQWAQRATWLEGDITRIGLPGQRYDVWHDRAVFHFLTDPRDRQQYVKQVLHALKPGGYVIVATFGPEGPFQCSGLDIVRYSPDTLRSEFGARFERVGSVQEEHLTPAGNLQQFIYCLCRVC
jgi:SAM-dependent methyltransferase